LSSPTDDISLFTTAMSDVGTRIKQRRKALGLSLEQLAKRIGCSKQTIGGYETGATKTVSMNVLFPLADALDVTPRWLAMGQGDMQAFNLVDEQERELVATYRMLPAAVKKHLVQSATSLAETLLPSPPFPKVPGLSQQTSAPAKKRR